LVLIIAGERPDVRHHVQRRDDREKEGSSPVAGQMIKQMPDRPDNGSVPVPARNTVNA
jgi:hypothetical protein